MPAGEHQHRKAWHWVVWSLLLSAAVLAIVLEVLVARAGPILKGRVIETLRTRFDGRVELDSIEVSVNRGLEVRGGGLRISPPDDVLTARPTAPLIGVRSFAFRASLLGLLFKPMHVETVFVTGLAIHIAPGPMRQHGPVETHRPGKIKIVVKEIVCDDSTLVIGNDKPDKDPKLFVLEHIVLHDVGPDAPWPYDAVLTNAIPKGEIHAVGSFGPWNTEAPGNSAASGRYVFEHADLNTIKGLGGMLHSTGTFDGQLDRIAVQGTTDVPNFSLDTANHAMPLTARFRAVVDGTTGDTYLQAVDATLGRSHFSCHGAVVNIRGRGHDVDLAIDVPAGRIEDFLQLAVKTRPPVMTGVISTRAKLHIRPGRESVTEKLRTRGAFTLHRIHFTDPQMEDKVDMLSMRAQGEPEKARPGAPDVVSQMTGTFDLAAGKLTFGDLEYTLPGASVALTGVYSLDGQRFEFYGKVRTEARLSQMVSSWWKRLLLKPVDPFFHKRGAGAEIPIRISGTRSAPKFGLNLHTKDNKR